MSSSGEAPEQHHHQQKLQQLGEERQPPTRTAARRLLSSEDGQPMLSFPVESLLRQQDADADGGRGLRGFLHGHHHRLRAWQLHQRLEDKKQGRAPGGDTSRSYAPSRNSTEAAAAAAAAAPTRTRQTRPPAAAPPLPPGAPALAPGRAPATEEGRSRRRLAASDDDDDDDDDGDDRGATAADADDVTARLPLRASVGTHFVHAHVGTPPQSVRLIVDTGSYTTAFPCVGCGKCRPGSAATLWDPTLSSTGVQLDCRECSGGYKCSKFEPTCSYKQSYSEGSSWIATQMNDVFRLGAEGYLEDFRGGVPGAGEEGWPRIDFGCIRKQTGMFNMQVPDGIIGLGPHKDSSIWTLTKRESPQDRKFSLCFSKEGGNMVLGGYHPELLLKPEEGHRFAPVTLSEGFFEVEVLDVRLGGVSIVDPDSLESFAEGTGTIVDSGTTDTYLPRSVEGAFSQAWKAATGQEYEPCPGSTFCLEFTPQQAEGLPVLAFKLGGGPILEITPEHYLEGAVRGDPPRTLYASRIYLTEWSGAVLGANAMYNRNVLFDLANQRVGFADARCDRGTAYSNPEAVDDDEEEDKGEEEGVEGGGGSENGGDVKEEEEEEEGESDKSGEQGDGAEEDEREKEGVGGGGGDNNGDAKELEGDKNGDEGGEKEEEEEEEEEEEDKDGGTSSGADKNGRKGEKDGSSAAAEEGKTKKMEGDEEDRGGGGGGGGVVKDITVPEEDGGAVSSGRPRPPSEAVKEGGDKNNARVGQVAAGGDDAGRGGERDESSGERGVADGNGHGPETACLWRMWEPCREECMHDLPKVDGCSGKRETRPCHTGSRCTSVSDGIYAELSFELDLGFRSAADHHGGRPAAEDAAHHEDRWRLRVGDALADAVASVLPARCGVLPGDVAVSVLPARPPPQAEGVPDGDGGGGERRNVKPPPRQLETVVTSVHFWRSEDTEEQGEQQEQEERGIGGVALAMGGGGGGGVDQARCVSALAEPSVAVDVAALAARDLSLLAGREATGTAAWESEAGRAGEEDRQHQRREEEQRWSLGDVAALAERMSVVAEGRLAVRNAPSGHRVIDLASSAGQGGKNARKAAAATGGRGGGVLSNNNEGGGGGGSGTAVLDVNGHAPPSAGYVAFGMQAGGGIMVLGVLLLLLLLQRVRSSSSSSPASSSSRGRDGARSSRRTVRSGLPNPPAGNGGGNARMLGADEDGYLHHGAPFDKGDKHMA
eukprot:g5281.t1